MGRAHSVAAAAAVLVLLCSPPAPAQSTIPPTFEVLADEFDAGTLENWVIAPGSVLGLEAGAAHSGAAGLEVTISAAKSHLVRGGRRELARADEAYLTFWFDPNGVVLPGAGGDPPAEAIQVAAVRGPAAKSLVALWVHDQGGSYRGFLEWRDATDAAEFDWESGSFDLTDGWQEITLGVRADGWVACWIDGVNVRNVTSGVNHFEPYASVIAVGKTLGNVFTAPSGTVHFDEASFHLPRYPDLWVDAASGDDANDGLSPGTAFATVGRASDLAGAGTTVHVQPGVYRETIVPAQGGLPGESAVYAAAAGAGTVVIRGSEASSSLSWTQLDADTIGLPPGVDPSAIWWADLSSWELGATPLFVVRMDGSGGVAERLPRAREPDWQPSPGHLYSDLWWQADGGSSMAGCDPATDPDPDCDAASRSSLSLTDRTDDADPAGIEPGNLTTLTDLAGATLIARGTVRGSFRYRRTIVDHDVAGGRVTVDEPCERAAGEPGLGWGSQYYVEDRPSLLDSPGEWWYDDATGLLYLWPPAPGDPAGQSLEISRRGDAFDFLNLSHVTLENLDVELFNGVLVNGENLATWHSSVGNSVIGCRLRYANWGIALKQTVESCCHADKRVEGFLAQDNEIAHMDYAAIRVTHVWDSDSHPDDWTRPGVFDVSFVGNAIHDIGFRPPPGDDTDAGSTFVHADRLSFVGNTVSDIFHDGVAFGRSLVQSPESWGFLPSEIVIGENLVRDNVIERACLVKSDCGALRFWGLPPDNHVFRDLLLIGNTVRDTVGYARVAALRGLDSVGQIAGAGGSGLYMDNTTGLHAYRNIAYNNGMAGFRMNKTWRDGKAYFLNNVVADNTFGFLFQGLFEDTHAAVDARVLNNVVVNNEAHGVIMNDLDGDYANIVFDRNLYHANGWGSSSLKPGAWKIVNDGSQEFLQTLAEVVANTPFEDTGQEGDPGFLSYDPSDHDPFDGSRPDFRLIAGSLAVDSGTATLPTSLADTLTLFGISDPPQGAAYDQGAFEGENVCEDLTVADRIVSTDQTFATCRDLYLGPDLHFTAGDITLQAGGKIIFESVVSIDAGVTVTAIAGQIPQ